MSWLRWLICSHEEGFGGWSEKREKRRKGREGRDREKSMLDLNVDELFLIIWLIASWSLRDLLRRPREIFWDFFPSLISFFFVLFSFSLQTFRKHHTHQSEYLLIPRDSYAINIYLVLSFVPSREQRQDMNSIATIGPEWVELGMSLLVNSSGGCVCVCVHMRVCVHVEGVNGGRELTRKELTDGSAWKVSWERTSVRVIYPPPTTELDLVHVHV